MVATSRLFAIINVAVCMAVFWLAVNTNKLSHHNWGACSIYRVFDIFHTALSNILDDITLVHDKSTMVFTFQYMVKELPDFKTFLFYKFHNKNTEFLFKSQTKAFPLKKLVEELFLPQDHNNKDSTTMMYTLDTIAVKSVIKDLEYKTEAAYKYLSISGT